MNKCSKEEEKKNLLYFYSKTLYIFIAMNLDVVTPTLHKTLISPYNKYICDTGLIIWDGTVILDRTDQ